MKNAYSKLKNSCRKSRKKKVRKKVRDAKKEEYLLEVGCK